MNKIKNTIAGVALICCFSCEKKTNDVAPEASVETVRSAGTTTVQPVDTAKGNSDTLAAPVIGLELGNIAPELNLKDTDDVYHRISDLRGKLVLIDFWASWCKPCRIENKNLKNIYPQFKDAGFKNGKGFEVYSVSIDGVKKGWLYSLQADKYNWKYNVIDSAAWNERGAVLYQVSAIPRNFLINDKGIIIAKDLRGAEVEKTLSALLN